MVKKKKGMEMHRLIFIVLLALVLGLAMLNVAKAKGWLIPPSGEIQIYENTVVLGSMTTEQKIAQMVVGIGTPENRLAWQNMDLGGIYLYARETDHIFRQTIIDYQYGMTIPFFVTADFEGCFNPFTALTLSKPNSEIKTIGEAFEKGAEDGAFMSDLGFTLNFAPVVDLDDSIWGCRAFPGDKEGIAALAQAYTLGLQDQGIIATAKHYPGKTLVVRDPHKFVVAAEIGDDDIFPYEFLASKGDVKAIMVSHLITVGSVDSSGVPAVVSPSVMAGIRSSYDGLIISDEIHMLGLRNFYDTVDDMYIAVFAAGNDVILNFDTDPNEVYRMIKLIASAVDDGVISEDQIDASVIRILEAKGFEAD
ncbi:glycoside hydrolase family 3 protein [Candidatus Woesearchaeota archaeon]|jgi:beta-N-acetylhexosaminidase|nr:glycoside hydrolase family 3 protein [Candidatus Woesearchaeota archaeon]MBT5740579.1 glycoside hydrolase family 3 protein [Candidatus Woesearchaeota archaeon]